MTELRWVLAAALGVAPMLAHAGLPAIPEATEAPVAPPPDALLTPAGCLEALSPVRCEVDQLVTAEVARLVALRAWGLPLETDLAMVQATLAVPTTEEEKATRHLVYHLSFYGGPAKHHAVVDAETGAVVSHYVSHIRRGRPLRGPTSDVRAPLVDATSLPPLAAAWAEAALDEAASVRAFEVHAEELQALGAPQDLVDRALRAAADEARHAEAAFALASRFAGRPVVAGPLPAVAPPRTACFDVARGVLLEGCINETLALAEAREALVRCVDGGVRSALEAVVREETQHAELSYETLRWALGKLSTIERAQLRDELLAYDVPQAAGPAVADGFGILSPGAAQPVRARAFREVVQPLLLLGLRG